MLCAPCVKVVHVGLSTFHVTVWASVSEGTVERVATELPLASSAVATAPVATVVASTASVKWIEIVRAPASLMTLRWSATAPCR